MPESIEQHESDRDDNLSAETGRNCPITPPPEDMVHQAKRRKEQWRALDQRDRKQRERLRDRKQRERTQATEDPEASRLARARLRGLRAATPDATGRVMSQALPFEAYEPAQDFVFSDPLPAYIDWTAFRYLNGPGPGLARWLADRVPLNADVVPVVAPDSSEWARFGAPLIAEWAQPALPRQRDRLRQELRARMASAPVLARKPGRQAPRKGRPMWAMNVVVARDIYGISISDVADALDLQDETGRSAGRYLAMGCSMLSRLGAWPWCVRDGGLLPNRWFVEQEYLEPFARWHYQQALAALAAAFSPLASVGRRLPGTSAMERARQWARAAYPEHYER